MKIQEDLAHLAQEKEAMVDFVVQLCNINSGSFNAEGVGEVAERFKSSFQTLDCEMATETCPPFTTIDSQGQTVQQPMGPILRFWKRPEAPKQVLLVGHMDTVYPSDHPFQKVERPKPNILHGPGVADMKGGIAVILWALRAFEKQAYKDRLGWEVILTPDEEIGSLGSGPLLEKRAKHHHVGMVFEPSMDDQGTLAYHRKGSGKFTVVVHGRAAHVGRQFEAGRSAIVAMARVVQAIDALNGQREGVVLNVGQIHGGVAVNVVPDVCVCHIDVRMPTLEDEAWIQTHLQKAIQGAPQPDGIRVELTGGFGRKPKRIDAKTAELFQCVREVAALFEGSIGWKDSGGCCDGNNLAHAGLLNVDTLGVRGGKIHSDEEYLIVDSLTQRAQLAAGVLCRLAGV